MGFSAAGVNLSFPTTADMTQVVRNIAVDPTRFRGAEILPDKEEYAMEIIVDVIEATTGIAGPRALGGNFNQASLSGNSVRKYATAYWGDTYTIEEEELLYARQEGTFNERAGYQRVLRRTVELDTRLESLKEKLRWDAITKGKIAVNQNGVNFTVDYKIPAANKKSYNLLSDANFDPTDMFQDISKCYYGTGGKPDTLWMNIDMAEALAKNAVIRDLLKQSTYSVTLSPDNVPSIMNVLFPKFKFATYDEGYKDKNGNFTPFIPYGTFAVTGKGPEKGADFVSTIAAQKGGIQNPQPGKFALVKDKSMEDVPFIKLTVGMNGLPRFLHPEWFVNGTIQ